MNRAARPEEGDGNRDGEHTNDDRSRCDVAGTCQIVPMQQRNGQCQNQARQQYGDQYFKDNAEQQFHHDGHHGTMKHPMNCQMYW